VKERAGNGQCAVTPISPGVKRDSSLVVRSVA
jgi:hypothetical protein